MNYYFRMRGVKERYGKNAGYFEWQVHKKSPQMIFSEVVERGRCATRKALNGKRETKRRQYSTKAKGSESLEH